MHEQVEHCSEKLILDRFAFLQATTRVEDYIPAVYYDRLLKEYEFSGTTDLMLFDSFLSTALLPGRKTFRRALELGCGTGRSASVLVNNHSFDHADLVDLSNQMMAGAQERFMEDPRVTFHKSDSLEFLNSARPPYDVAFSLWSFSHSVHQMLLRDGLDVGTKNVKQAIDRLFTELLEPGGKFFLLHFDSCSEEQYILMRQWKKIWPIIDSLDEQSPSKQVVDAALQALTDRGIIEYSSVHLMGDAIEYDNINDAMEVFFNFHLECALNDTPHLPQAVSEIQAYMKAHTTACGTVQLKPGCFLYECKRLDQVY
jgi:SAM-dependent methyltransferase